MNERMLEKYEMVELNHHHRQQCYHTHIKYQGWSLVFYTHTHGYTYTETDNIQHTQYLNGLFEQLQGCVTDVDVRSVLH